MCDAEVYLRRALSLRPLVLNAVLVRLMTLLVYTFPWAAFVWQETPFDWFQLRQLGYVTNGLGEASSWYVPSGLDRLAGQ